MERKTRSAIQYWNFLREDSFVKGAILFRMKDRNLEFKDLSQMMDVPVYKIRHYLNGKTPNLNNFEIVKLGNILGIKLEVKIEFTDDTIGIP